MIINEKNKRENETIKINLYDIDDWKLYSIIIIQILSVIICIIWIIIDSTIVTTRVNVNYALSIILCIIIGIYLSFLILIVTQEFTFVVVLECWFVGLNNCRTTILFLLQLKNWIFTHESRIPDSSFLFLHQSCHTFR